MYELLLASILKEMQTNRMCFYGNQKDQCQASFLMAENEEFKFQLSRNSNTIMQRVSI